MTLLETRKQYGVSQAEAAAIVSVPLRTYIRYERDETHGSKLKRSMMIQTIVDAYEITETKGILTLESIKTSLGNLFDGQFPGKIEFCYLFGSYAKGYATMSSDVDLCVATSLSGLDFVGLSESIRIALHKRVDLGRLDTLSNNRDLLGEIMKDGIKVYG